MAFRNMCFLGTPNLVTRNYCDVSLVNAIYEPAGMEASKLKTEQPGEVARITTLVPDYTQWLFSFNEILGFFDGFAVCNFSLSPNGRWRIVGGASGLLTQVGYSSVAPTAILSNVNTTGTVSNVDEITEAPDSVYIGPSALTDEWNIRFAIGAVSTPEVGPHRVFFVLFVKLFDNGFGGSNTLTYPQISVELWEDGGLTLDLGHKAVTSYSGQYMIFSFDAAELSNPDGSGIEVQISCTTGESIADNRYVKLDLVRLYYEADSGDFAYDSGWIENTGAQWGNDADGEQPTLSVDIFPALRQELSSFAVLVCDDHCVANPLGNNAPSFPGIPIGLISKLPDSFIQAGMVVAGEAEFTEGILRNPHAATPRIEAISTTSQAGNVYIADAFAYRAGEPIDIMVTRESGVRMTDKIAWRKGKAKPVYVAMEPDVERRFKLFSSYIATVRGWGSMIPIPKAYTGGASDLYSITVQLDEKL